MEYTNLQQANIYLTSCWDVKLVSYIATDIDLEMPGSRNTIVDRGLDCNNVL